MSVPRGFLPSAAVSLLVVLSAAAALAAGGAPAGGSLYVGGTAAGDLALEPVGGAVRPVLAGAELVNETGKPVLPMRAVQLLVAPQSPIAGLEIVPLQTRRIELEAPLDLGRPLVTDAGVEVPVDRLELGADSFPAIWGEFGGSHVWRGFRFVSAVIYPVRALRGPDGRWTALEVLERYEVRPVYDAGAPVPEVLQRERLVPGERARCEAVLRELCANPEALSGYERSDGQVVAAPPRGFQPTMTPSISGSPVSYVIVTRDALAAAWQPLADYKTSLGLPAKVVTVEWIEANYRHGVDPQETIRRFLREAYARWGLQYVLIGGDTDIVPARYATSTYYPIGGYTEIPTDLYFGALDGTWNADGDWVFAEHYSSYYTAGDEADMAEDVYVGRAPVSTAAEATAYANKVIAYEGTAAGAGWPGRALFAAEVLFPSEYTPGDPISLDGAYFAEGIADDYITTCTSMTAARMFETYALTDTLGQLVYPGSVRLTRAALIDTLNHGHHGILNQIGHGFYFNMSVGDANFTVGDADGLTNNGRPFLLYALNCASAAFDYSCLMERFLRNPSGGSIVSIGASRAAFPHTANNYQREFFRQLYCEGETRAGRLLALSKLPYLPYTYTNTVDRWTVLNYTLLGDPSVAIWRGVPRTAQVSAPASLPGGQQNVNVTVNAGGSPVANALVCLAKSGDDYAWGLTGPTGQVVLPFTASTAGQAVLTVSGPNLARSSRNIPISLGAGAYVRAESATVQDSGAGGTSGNGNGTAEAGETVGLLFTFRNTGSAASVAGTATLTTAEAGVTIIDNTAAVGAIPAGGTAVAGDPFLVQLDPSVADGEFLDFVVTVAAAGSFASEWSLTGEAPEVEPVELVWSDAAPYGNGNGTLESGERVSVRIYLKNFGAGRADLVTGRLRTLDPDLVLVDTLVTWSGLETLSRSSGSGVFSLRENDVLTESWAWVLFTDSQGRSFRHDFKLRPPTAPTGLETNPSLGPDIIALNWLPMRNVGVRGYNVYRSDAPAGPFTRQNLDLLEWTSYFRDGGLGLLTRYYYRVTAVDSSLVEGPPCPVVSQSTAPPELAGFPLPFAVETSNHLAVGDVNGDGIEEIVLAADEVYVWNALGEELFDGDNDAQTHGPITNLSTDFGLGGVALANLDGVPGLEIIVPERNSLGGQNALHVFRHDGTELPGWPRPLRQTSSGSAWSVPAVGDVDGDGDLEVVLNTQDSRTWVWHHDGTELRDGDANAATVGVFVSRAYDWEYGKASPSLCDLDGDGAAEIIFGTKIDNVANYIMAYKYDGTQAPGFPYSTGTETSLASAAVADLDHDGFPEIVLNTRFGKLYVVRHDGTNYPGFPRTLSSGTGFNPSPAVGDFDNDGYLEIVMISTTSTLNSNIHVVDTNGPTSGQTLAGWPQSVPGNSESNPVVADIDGDGFLDVVFGIGGGNTESPNNLYAFKHTGQAVDGFPITLGGPVRPTPVLNDFDHDGDIDIIYGGWDLNIHVWDMPFAYNPHLAPWPTFRGHMHRDGVKRSDTLVGVPEAGLPAALTLLSPAPNPFNPTTRVRLFLPGREGALVPLEVTVYDLRGRLVKTLHAGPLAAGWHDWIWDGRDGQGRAQSSGLYLLRARSEGQTAVRKMSLLK